MGNIISRKQAIELDLKRYFTGIPCKRDHIAERLVNHGGCLTCHNARNRTWARNNPDKDAAARRKYYVANRSRKAAYRKAWQIANRDKVRAYCRDWCASNHEYMVTKVRNRNAKKRGNGGRHTSVDIEQMLAAQGYKCAYFAHCGAVLTPRNKHVDHITPIVMGGSNNRDNLQILCRCCNLSKGSKDPIDHLRSIGLSVMVDY